MTSTSINSSSPVRTKAFKLAPKIEALPLRQLGSRVGTLP